MSLTTNLAHYQLPRADVVPVRPAVLSDQPPSQTTPTAVADAPERVLPPMAYKQWLKLLTGYEASARPAPVAAVVAEIFPGKKEL